MDEMDNKQMTSEMNPKTIMNEFNKMNIRPIEEKDLAAVAEFEIAISIISFGEEAVTDPEFHIRKLRKAMLQERPGMLVLDIEGEVSGWLWMTPKTNFVTKETYMNFKSFYIKDSHRGTDYVEDLMDAGMAYSREQQARRIVGHVHVSNLPMRALYKNYGFKPVHLTMEYDANEDESSGGGGGRE